MVSSGGRLSRVTEVIVLCQREGVMDWWATGMERLASAPRICMKAPGAKHPLPLPDGPLRLRFCGSDSEPLPLPNPPEGEPARRPHGLLVPFQSRSVVRLDPDPEDRCIGDIAEAIGSAKSRRER